jgi:hypothetical protein
MLATAALERMVRGASLSVARPRIALPAAGVRASTRRHELDHPSGAQKVSVTCPPTPFDVLRAFPAAGLARRDPPGSVARYVAGRGTTTTTSCAGRAVRSLTWLEWVAAT